MIISHSTLEKLQKFEFLFQNGHSSVLIDKTLNKLAEIEVFELKKNLRELTAKIEQFEKQYLMSSEKFSKEFNAGQLGDSADFIEWFAYYDMQSVLLKKIGILDKAER